MILPEKNGDLMVDGVLADSFVPEFYNFDELRQFEFSAYMAYDLKYGGGACERDEILCLADLFGESFANRILTRRNKLQAIIGLRELEEEFCHIKDQISRYKWFVDNPGPVWNV